MILEGMTVQESRVNLEDRRPQMPPAWSVGRASGSLYQGRGHLLAITNLAKHPAAHRTKPAWQRR